MTAAFPTQTHLIPTTSTAYSLSGPIEIPPGATLGEDVNGRKVITWPADAISTDACDLIKWDINNTPTAPSLKPVISQLGSVTKGMMYPRFPVSCNNAVARGDVLSGLSHINNPSDPKFGNLLQTARILTSTGQNLSVQHVLNTQEIETMKSQKYADTAASVAMELQSMCVTSNAEMTSKNMDIQFSNEMAEMTLGNIHHALTKVDTARSGVDSQATMLHGEAQTSSGDFGKSHQNCYTLMANAKISDGFIHTTPILTENQVTVSKTTDSNVSHLLQGNLLYGSNNIKKVRVLPVNILVLRLQS